MDIAGFPRSSFPNVETMLQNIVNRFPGIRYREVMRLSGLSNGVLSYHLHLLEKSGRIRAQRQSRVTRLYPPSMSHNEATVIAALRQIKARQIILYLIEKGSSTFNDIVGDVNRSKTTVYWYLGKLQDAGLVKTSQADGRLIYSVNNREEIIRLMSRYRSSFLDKMVDNFLDNWCEL